MVSPEASLLGLQMATFLLLLCRVFSPYIHLSLVSISSSYKYTSQIRLGPVVWPRFNLIISLKTLLLGFPSGAVVKKESACQCRGHRFEPWSRKIPHAAEQLSPCAITTEPAHLEPMLCNKKSHYNEKPAHRNKERPLLTATRRKQRRPNTAKNK